MRSGYIDLNSGRQKVAGSNSYAWSSTAAESTGTYGARAQFMYVTADGEIRPSYLNPRSTAFSLRCLAD